MYFLLKNGDRRISLFSFYLFKLLGLAPITCRFANNNDEDPPVGFTNSPLGTVYNLFLSSVVLASVCFRLRHLVQLYVGSPERNGGLLFLICDGFYSTLGIVVVLLAMGLRQSDLGSLLTLSARVQRSLPQRRRRNRLHARYCCIHAMILAQIVSVFGIVFGANNVDVPLLGKLCAIDYMSSYFAVCAQYSMLATLMADALAQTGLDLSTLAETPRRTEDHFSTLGDALRSAQRLYETVIELADRVADFYSAIMLPTVARYLVFIASHFYVLTRMLLNEQTRRPEFRLYLGGCFYLFTPILVLSVLTSEAIRQNKKYVKTLTDVLHRYDDHDGIRDQVDVSLRYTLNNRVSFRIYDLFVIDNSLVLTIIGTSCTSCIILLQLRTPPDS